MPPLIDLPLAARYGIEAVASLAQGAPHEYQRARDVAARLGLPREFLAKVFRRLLQAGFVAARRGPGGGYRLADEASRLRLVDIAEAACAVAPAPRPCLLFSRVCGSDECSAHHAVAQAEHGLREALATLTVADIQGDLRVEPTGEKPGRLLPSISLVPVLLIVLLGFAACKGQDMEVYRAPKQAAEAETTMTTAQEPKMPGPDLQRAEEKSALVWDAPKTWKPKPAGGMRFATFEVPTKTGEAELAIVVLAGDAGGALPNVNRWRGQLGLPPVDDGALQKGAKEVRSAAGPLLVVDLIGADGKSGLLGAILPQATQTWFFKLTGSSKATSAARTSVLQFLAGLR